MGLNRRLLCAVLGIGLLVGGGLFGQEPATSSEDHPLEPSDRSSPRATLETFTTSIEQAWEYYKANDPRTREVARRARRCLDVSQVPPTLVDNVELETALLLKEVLDRVELPLMAAVPGADAVEAEGIERWTIPHTEIELVRVKEGPRAGQFLFSPGTVENVAGYYEAARRLPYQPGKEGVHYDELRFGAKSRTVASIVAMLPSWAKHEYFGQLGWQWVVIVCLVALSILLVSAAFWLGRRMQRAKRQAFRIVGSLLAPLAMISLQWDMVPLIPWHIQLGGRGVRAIGTGFVVAGVLGTAWLVAVLIGHLARLLIHLTRADERPLHQQLILVSSKIVSVAAIVLVLFKGGQALGIPVSALVTGLGVGGLAVALSAQSTLENLIGGINLFADRPVRIGDFCKFGDDLGVVEAIGLRSTRVRTLARTMISIPNSSFAGMQLENLSLRDRMILRTRLRLGYDTSAEQVEGLLETLRERFEADERIAEEPFRVRLLDINSDGLEVELNMYVLTEDWSEYLAIREELLLAAMRIVEEAGLRLMPPTERHEVVQASEES